MFQSSAADYRVGIIELRYISLPAALEFGTRYPSVGIDINQPDGALLIHVNNVEGRL